MASARFPDKDPDETLDYTLDWSRWLSTDTIQASTWAVPDGLTEDASSHGDDTATVWLSGGTVGTAYTLVNTITTTGGRVAERSVSLRIRSK